VVAEIMDPSVVLTALLGELGTRVAQISGR
jgi:hypothetical protein